MPLVISGQGVSGVSAQPWSAHSAVQPLCHRCNTANRAARLWVGNKQDDECHAITHKTVYAEIKIRFMTTSSKQFMKVKYLTRYART